MKNILLTYRDIYNVNIGDYIQSIAAKQFYEENDELQYVNRDELGLYDGDTAKVIMNGWFTYKPKSWLPARSISPLFVAFHLNSKIKDEVLDVITIEYLKAHSPIGCRDSYTVNILKEKGISAYFSSCLTTTLGYRFPAEKQRNNDVFIVDPYSYMPRGKGVFELILTVFQLLFNIYPIIKLIKKYKKDNQYVITFTKIGVGRVLIVTKTYLLLKKILEPDLIWKARYITHYHAHTEYASEEERFNRAQELIELYASASYVITSRIHAAFPCLGLETPVAYIRNLSDTEASSCRLFDIDKFFNIIEVKNGRVLSSFLKEKFKINSKFLNKTHYKKFRMDLIIFCKKFVNS